jgi:hypothetical protein
MKCINVKSTFAENNLAFSSATEAVEYAEGMKRRANLNFPVGSALIVKAIEFGSRDLNFAFEKDTVLRFTLRGSVMTASYGALDGRSAAMDLSAGDEIVSLRFTKSAICYEWRPLSVLNAVMSQKLLDWYALKNQYYLYFENCCVYVGTLFDVDAGELFLFWTPSN